MTTVSADRDFISIGQVAAGVQRPVRRIEQAATELNITPSMRVDGRPYFDAGQVETLTTHIKRAERKGNK